MLVLVACAIFGFVAGALIGAAIGVYLMIRGNP